MFEKAGATPSLLRTCDEEDNFVTVNETRDSFNPKLSFASLSYAFRRMLDRSRVCAFVEPSRIREKAGTSLSTDSTRPRSSSSPSHVLRVDAPFLHPRLGVLSSPFDALQMFIQCSSRSPTSFQNRIFNLPTPAVIMMLEFALWDSVQFENVPIYRQSAVSSFLRKLHRHRTRQSRRIAVATAMQHFLDIIQGQGTGNLNAHSIHIARPSPSSFSSTSSSRSIASRSRPRRSSSSTSLLLACLTVRDVRLERQF